ncbi:MAG: ATP-binding protein, partial [Thermoleophilaceae bacterium]
MTSTAARQLPSGTVTFLFTDIEGSTRLLTALGDRYAPLLERHGKILRDAIGQHGGTVVSTEGDSFFAVFGSAPEALRAAVDAQRGLAAEAWPMGSPIRVRMGLHSGEGRLGGDNYVGLDVHRAARIAAAGFGGQVLLSDATKGLVRQELPEGVALRDLGEHRFRDLSLAERIWQLVIEGLPREFPALRSVGASAGNLPLATTPLIGRQRELDQIDRLLGERRLLTLTGPGGTGKTRLALAAAERLQPNYPDGAWFVALESAVDRATVTAGIATALGVRDRPDRDLAQGVADFVRERQLLLVLDNLEQALIAAPMVGALLGGARHMRMIVTSRAALHLAGEQEFSVPPLALPDPQHLPDHAALSQYEAVALFIARARAVRPDFAVTTGNARAVAEICSRLDGLPLAIELAGAAIKLLNPQAILERLERHLPIPGAGLADVPARQRTLRAAIDWSYELLGDPERRLLVRLAVFAGGWTLDAAERVCNPDRELGIDTLDGLAALADASLVNAVDSDEDGGEPRFAMLQVIRDYAGERLAAETDADEVLRRHAAYLLDLVETAEPELVRSELRRWQRRLRREQENLRVALRWAIERGETTIGQRLAGALWRYWHYWGELREARRWLESVLAMPDGAPAARATAMVGLAGVIYWQGEADAAERLYEEALAILRELGDERRMAETVFATVYTAIARDDLAGALARSDEAIERYRRAGDEASARLIAIQSQLARTYYMGGGATDEAIALTREAIELSGALGRAHEQTEWLGSLADLYRTSGNFARAMDVFRDTTRAWYALGNVGVLPYLKLAASIELGLGRPARAVRTWAGARHGPDGVVWVRATSNTYITVAEMLRKPAARPSR